LGVYACKFLAATCAIPASGSFRRRQELDVDAEGPRPDDCATEDPANRRSDDGRIDAAVSCPAIQPSRTFSPGSLSPGPASATRQQPHQSARWSRAPATEDWPRFLPGSSIRRSSET